MWNDRITASAGSASDGRHLDQGEASGCRPRNPCEPIVIVRAERGQDGEQVGGERRAAMGVVAGHEDVAGDAARAAHLVAGDEGGVPLQGPQAGRLLGRPPADHFGREIDQPLDRHRGTDVECPLRARRSGRSSAMPEMSIR